MYEDVKLKEETLSRGYELKIAKLTNEIELLRLPCKKCQEEDQKKPEVHSHYLENLML